MSDDWYAELGEVLLRKRDRSLWIVNDRHRNVDTGEHQYRLCDDTLTTDTYIYADDLKQCYVKTSVIVCNAHKPKNRLDGRLYDDDWCESYIGRYE